LRRINIGYFYAVIAGIVSGLVPVIVQGVLSQETISKTTGLFIKLAVSSLILLPYAIPKIKKERIPPHFYQKILVASLLYVVTLVFLYESYHYIPTGISISLHYTFPFFTMVLSALLFGVRPAKLSVAAMILSLVGVALLSIGSLSIGGNPVGILLAIGSALAYAACFLWIEHTKLTTLDTGLFVALKTFGAAILLFPYVLATSGLDVSISSQTFFGLLLGGVFTLLASFLLMIAIRHIGSVHTSILSSTEPIVCAVAGVLFLGEKVSLKSSIGIVIVLTATIMVTLSKQESKANSKVQNLWKN